MKINILCLIVGVAFLKVNSQEIAGKTVSEWLKTCKQMNYDSSNLDSKTAIREEGYCEGVICAKTNNHFGLEAQFCEEPTQDKVCVEKLAQFPLCCNQEICHNKSESYPTEGYVETTNKNTEQPEETILLIDPTEIYLTSTENDYNPITSTPPSLPPPQTEQPESNPVDIGNQNSTSLESSNINNTEQDNTFIDLSKSTNPNFEKQQLASNATEDEETVEETNIENQQLVPTESSNLNIVKEKSDHNKDKEKTTSEIKETTSNSHVISENLSDSNEVKEETLKETNLEKQESVSTLHKVKENDDSNEDTKMGKEGITSEAKETTSNIDSSHKDVTSEDLFDSSKFTAKLEKIKKTAADISNQIKVQDLDNDTSKEEEINTETKEANPEKPHKVTKIGHTSDTNLLSDHRKAFSKQRPYYNKKKSLLFKRKRKILTKFVKKCKNDFLSCLFLLLDYIKIDEKVGQRSSINKPNQRYLYLRRNLKQLRLIRKGLRKGRWFKKLGKLHKRQKRSPNFAEIDVEEPFSRLPTRDKFHSGRKQLLLLEEEPAELEAVEYKFK